MSPCPRPTARRATGRRRPARAHGLRRVRDVVEVEAADAVLGAGLVVDREDVAEPLKVTRARPRRGSVPGSAGTNASWRGAAGSQMSTEKKPPRWQRRLAPTSSGTRPPCRSRHPRSGPRPRQVASVEASGRHERCAAGVSISSLPTSSTFSLDRRQVLDVAAVLAGAGRENALRPFSATRPVPHARRDQRQAPARRTSAPARRGRGAPRREQPRNVRRRARREEAWLQALHPPR